MYFKINIQLLHVNVNNRYETSYIINLSFSNSRVYIFFKYNTFEAKFFFNFHILFLTFKISIQLVYFQDLNVGINIWIKRNNICWIHITHTLHVHVCTCICFLHFHCFKESSNIFLSKYENFFRSTYLQYRLTLSASSNDAFSFTIDVF